MHIQFISTLVQEVRQLQINTYEQLKLFELTYLTRGTTGRRFQYLQNYHFNSRTSQEVRQLFIFITYHIFIFQLTYLTRGTTIIEVIFKSLNKKFQLTYLTRGTTIATDLYVFRQMISTHVPHKRYD